jgi:Protein-L-isoaspartate(D-aspartate) O-methyltransferase (PCMT)
VSCVQHSFIFLSYPLPSFHKLFSSVLNAKNLTICSWAGYAERGPYDAIHVGAAARTIPPALVEQLATPGRMIIPVGTYSQKLMQVDKDAQGRITQRDLFGVVVRIKVFLCPPPDVVEMLQIILIGFLSQYVPLTDRPA